MLVNITLFPVVIILPSMQIEEIRSWLRLPSESMAQKDFLLKLLRYLMPFIVAVGSFAIAREIVLCVETKSVVDALFFVGTHTPHGLSTPLKKSLAHFYLCTPMKSNILRRIARISCS